MCKGQVKRSKEVHGTGHFAQASKGSDAGGNDRQVGTSGHLVNIYPKLRSLHRTQRLGSDARATGRRRFICASVPGDVAAGGAGADGSNAGARPMGP